MNRGPVIREGDQTVHWKILDFSKEIGKHYNTIDNWFKRMEEKKIHYINRTIETGEKTYDELDLQIALYIRDKRDEKWSLDVIFTDLPNRFDLRPFPIDENNNNDPQVIDTEGLKRQIKEEIMAAFRKTAASQLQLIKEDFLRTLPKPPTPEEERDRRMTDMITQHRVKSKLEAEALELWWKKPESERMRRIGFFRREEDRDKREQFVRRYIQEHYEAKVREDFGDN
ncbi:MerR family transcriptional regulator [Terrilactibacillus laevilacticus]|uniref:MerR family transcriptional regulator n=1 Tax=Terrilactibacillus laevilacticus TaxID=1380157 RepID=UPI00114631D9|nr:MerR family transcriptional regulator [Terrilactibacillus laevilacticus]